jgi:hypothetical protein
MVQEHRTKRPGRLRAFAVAGALLASLAVGGTVLAPPAAHAAVTSAAKPAASCGYQIAYFPSGDNDMLIEQPGFIVYILAELQVLRPTPVGYVWSSGLFTSQNTAINLADSPVGTLSWLPVSSMEIKLVYDPYVSGDYTFELLYNSCQWGAPVFGHANV